MDTAMRDLDQIQEQRDQEVGGRSAAMLATAAFCTVGLVFALGLVLDRASGDDAAAEADPLAALEAAAAAELAERESEADEGDPEVDPATLSFHESLRAAEAGSPEDDVAGVMAAVDAELSALPGAPAGDAMLAGGLADVAPGLGAPAPAPVVATDAPAAELLDAPAVVRPSEPIAAAEPGEEGPYMLQVVSYNNREQADTFAETLRQRGHRAFVMEAELPGRGTYYRVRIGPFQTSGRANRYRSRFEAAEEMSTLVIRRREP